MKQRPHYRKSKRGRVFRAGRGLLRRSFGMKTGGGLYEISDVVKFAEGSGLNVKRGSKHPYLIEAPGERVFPVAESTPRYALEQYFKRVTEHDPRLIKEYLRGRKLKDYGSQIMRENIRKSLVVEGPNKERIVKVMEKDPLLYQEFKQVGKPKIKMVENLRGKEDAFSLVDLSSNEISIDPILFKKKGYEPEKSIRSSTEYRPEKALAEDMPIIPRQLLAHEIQHIKNKPYTGSSAKMAEDAAFWRSEFDIRKHKPSPEKLDYDIRRGFSGPVLKRKVRTK